MTIASTATARRSYGPYLLAFGVCISFCSTVVAHASAIIPISERWAYLSDSDELIAYADAAHHEPLARVSLNISRPNLNAPSVAFEVLKEPSHRCARTGSRAVIELRSEVDANVSYGRCLNWSDDDQTVVVAQYMINRSSLPVTFAPRIELIDVGANSKSFGLGYSGPAQYSSDGGYRHVEPISIRKSQGPEGASLERGWLAIVRPREVVALVPPVSEMGTVSSRVRPDSEVALSYAAHSQLIAPGQEASSQATLYGGPKKRNVLEAVAPHLAEVMEFGWLDPIAVPLLWVLERLHDLVANWGTAVILLTVLVKACLAPLTAKSHRSARALSKLAPEIERMKSEFGRDKTKFGNAVLELYKAKGISPLSSLLPLLIQLPIFLALFAIMRGEPAFQGATWLWVNDLAAPDQIYILPGLLGLTLLVQAALSPVSSKGWRKLLVYLLPAVFGVAFAFSPAGCILYWLVQTALTALQQAWLNREDRQGSRVAAVA